MNYAMQSEPSLTTTEIMTIIESCEHILRFVQSSPNYKQIETSGRFSTSNDLKMGDAVQALVEINQAIVNFGFERQDEEIEDAFSSHFAA